MKKIVCLMLILGSMSYGGFDIKFDVNTPFSRKIPTVDKLKNDTEKSSDRSQFKYLWYDSFRATCAIEGDLKEIVKKYNIIKWELVRIDDDKIGILVEYKRRGE